MDYLLGYDFPGNIRELENLIEQGVALAQDGQIHLSDIVPKSNGNGGSLHPGRQSLADMVQEVERDAIVRALRHAEGNKERAAEFLGLSPTTLWRKMKLNRRILHSKDFKKLETLRKFWAIHVMNLFQRTNPVN